MKLVTVFAAVLVLGGCGKHDVAIVKRPILPIYVCGTFRESRSERCAGRFDAGRLIGLSLKDADRLAQTRGYVVRPVAPLPKGAALLDDYETNRIDVETSSPAGGIVVRLVRMG
jgi:hypothetical protein